MLEYLGFGIGGVALLSTVFMVGHNISKNGKFVKQSDCKDCKTEVKHDNEKMYQKINSIAEGVARIEGRLEEKKR